MPEALETNTNTNTNTNRDHPSIHQSLIPEALETNTNTNTNTSRDYPSIPHARGPGDLLLYKSEPAYEQRVITTGGRAHSNTQQAY